MKYLVIILLFFLNPILRSETVSEEVWKEEKKDFVYKKKAEEPEENNPKKQPSTPSHQKQQNSNIDLSWLDFLKKKEFLYTVIFIIVALVLVLLLRNITVPQKIKQTKFAYEDGNVEERLMETDIDRLIRLALENNNYQLAIRYTFLKTLKGMVEKNKLVWKKQYTNKDYLVQLYQTPYFEPFKSITMTYERKWYRNDSSTKEEYEHYTTHCNQLII